MSDPSLYHSCKAPDCHLPMGATSQLKTYWHAALSILCCSSQLICINWWCQSALPAGRRLWHCINYSTKQKSKRIAMLKHCCFDCINTNCSTILVYKSILHEGNQVATKSGAYARNGNHDIRMEEKRQFPTPH